MKNIVKKRNNFLDKWLMFMFIMFCFVSCQYSCRYNFYIDNGKNCNERYSIIKELDYAMFIGSRDTSFEVSMFTAVLDSGLIKNRGVEFKSNNLFLLFKNTNDTLYSNDKYKNIFSCENFKEKLRKNKDLYVKIDYTIDSVGVLKDYTKEYNLVKKRECDFSVRVH
jgi:hypothetical protein